MAINPEHIAKFNGKIVRTIFREDNIRFPTLFVTIRRDADSLEQVLGFCYNPEFMDGLEDDVIPTREELLKPIDKIYQGFGVSESSQLVGKSVTALYYNLNYNSPEIKRGKVTPNLSDHIIGVRRR